MAFSITNLRESFLERTCQENTVYSAPIHKKTETDSVVNMSPLVHTRLTKIESRLAEIEQRIKDEPFLVGDLRSPKSRTEWLFSWNETLQSLLKCNKVVAIKIANRKERSILQELVESIPWMFYSNLHRYGKMVGTSPSYIHRRLCIVDINQYFPLSIPASYAE
jgi:hypothetical protein